jgi:uroporphyrinogen decarboxylase
VIYYTKSSAHILPAAAESGADVLSVDWRVNLAELRQSLGPNIALQGNLDPASLFGPQSHIRQATAEILAQLRGAGHILNLGHGILPSTPVENARVFIETAQQTFFAEGSTASGKNER